MNRSMNILYPTDGSLGALAGAHLLGRLVLSPRDRVRLLHVLEGEGADSGDAALALQSTKGALCAAAEGTPPLSDNDGDGFRVTTETRRVRRAGTPVLSAILTAAEEAPTDLLVVGTRGLSAIARIFLGSVAARVARYAPCPVLVARPLVGELDRVVLGWDDTPGADRAAGWLETFPLPPGGEVHLVTALAPLAVPPAVLRAPELAAMYRGAAEHEQRASRARLSALAERLAAPGRSVTAEVVEGDPASALIETARARRADLLVVGAHGSSNSERFLLGGVAEKVLRHAPCSVAVIRPVPASKNSDIEP